ncbi:MAG: PAS domain-containing protein [Chitinivibrionales bacterium]|nr:PAS domain-containing protein [Chitinivibrionales bacterium]MBD3396470.1 PAS domain-containing protein [Chitinivibrionales bacterium]
MNEAREHDAPRSSASDRGVTGFFGSDGLARRVFEAIPSPAFVVDRDRRIVAANAAGESLMHGRDKTVYRTTAGLAFMCIHESDSAKGCGHGSFCEHCAINRSVSEAVEGNHVSKKKYRLERVTGDTTEDVYLLISSSPIEHNCQVLALVVLEDVTQLARLHSVLPICAKCKKIRNDSDYWENVETYMRDHENIGFTHSICPDCVAELYPDLSR